MFVKCVDNDYSCWHIALYLTPIYYSFLYQWISVTPRYTTDTVKQYSFNDRVSETG